MPITARYTNATPTKHLQRYCILSAEGVQLIGCFCTRLFCNGLLTRVYFLLKTNPSVFCIIGFRDDGLQFGNPNFPINSIQTLLHY